MNSKLPSNTPTRMAVVTGLALLALVLGALGLQGTPAGATGSTLVTYANNATVATPTPLAFSANGGGDGWAVAPNTTSALGTSQVFAVYHHSPNLQLQCLNQSDGSTCWGGPVTITDGVGGHSFATSGAPGLYLDPATKFLYVYAVETDGNAAHNTAGVVAIDTTLGASATGAQRFLSFTPLSAVGDAPIINQAGISGPIQIGNNWYAFNEVPGAYSRCSASTCRRSQRARASPTPSTWVERSSRRSCRPPRSAGPAPTSWCRSSGRRAP